MVTLARRVSRTPLAPVVGVMFGAVAAILVAAMPAWMFDKAVVESGLPSILSFAAPPLGLTARVLAMALGFIVVGGGLWLVLGLIEKALKPSSSKPAPSWHDEGYSEEDEPVKVEGRRRPIFAPTELGAPLMSDEAIAPALQSIEPEVAPILRTEPEPLPEPLSAVDHSTLTPEPELEKPLSAVEFDLPPSDTPDNDDSIQSLIRRLEAGLARRAANDPGPDSPASAPSPLALSKDWIVSDNDQPQSGADHDGFRQALGALKKFASL
jgi:hypothetical protein